MLLRRDKENRRVCDYISLRNIIESLFLLQIPLRIAVNLATHHSLHYIGSIFTGKKSLSSYIYSRKDFSEEGKKKQSVSSFGSPPANRIIPHHIPRNRTFTRRHQTFVYSVTNCFKFFWMRENPIANFAP